MAIQMRNIVRICHCVTTFQSVVTILNAKFTALARRPDLNLSIISNAPDANEKRTAVCTLTTIKICRNIQPLRDLVSVFRAYFCIRRKDFDVVHTHTAKAGIIGAIAAKLAGVPLICHTYHGLPFYEGQSPLAYHIYRTIELMCSRFRHVIFSQNRRDYETLKRIKSIAPKVVFEGNGVSVSEIEENVAKDSSRISDLFCTKNLKLLCVARLEPVKQLGRVIDAVGYLESQGIAVECIIAGKGELESELRQLIDQKKLAEKIKIVYTPHIHALISKSDIVLLSSDKEGLPRGLMEAMALKKPVVATKVLGTEELVIPEETGLLVALSEKENIGENIGKAVMRLAKNPALCQKLGEAGRQRILEHFDDAKVVDLWMDVYKKHLAK